MSGHIERSAEWIYRGVWRLLVDCFRVPQEPPSLPISTGAPCHTFHPSRRYLAYLKLYFWIALVIIDIAIMGGWLAIVIWQPLLGWILLLPALAIAIVPDVIAYVAIHLRYDTMWYVMSDRSLRARRGIWVILEHTITFENVQNVYVRQGPVQQMFGISEVIVETAGASEGESENPFAIGNKAIMEGIDNPEQIRQLIMERVQATRSAGLGDEIHASREWSQNHVQLLGAIRNEIQCLAKTIR